MKITVLNGSPKGVTSVTMQYVHYIQKEYPQHELKIINISQRIKKIESDERAFQEILDEVKASDGILWASPVYFFLVPSNYKRFIELIFERNAELIFAEKYTACLTTSIHFFDHTAHNYIHAVCDDLNMRYVGSFSADMGDLAIAAERERLSLFAGKFFEVIENKSLTPRSYMPVARRDFDYLPGEAGDTVSAGGKKIVVVTDAQEHQVNLVRMVERFSASFSGEIAVINLHALDIKGSCLGCIQCGYDNQCAYKDKDEYIDFYNTKLKTADILIFAGTIQDRYLSSRWKMFFDRSFFNGHAPSLIGKQIGFIISGPLSQNQNLRQILETWVEIQHANLAGIVTDEYGDSAQIDSLLQELARNLVRFAESGYIGTPTFLGVGGTKLFRDEIWGRLRFPFRADYLAYKKLGVFDFPQKNYKIRIQIAIMSLLSKSPGFRKEVNKRMKEEMIKPLQKVLDGTSFDR
ncbi:MAG: NAD(P)H-dependent oxidoreductase [Chloroflexi bacterium]|nr:NAD(P)H-dependent oxidoreductase [Chloroflexota bacterium]